jgi:hypothetical protein
MDGFTREAMARLPLAEAVIRFFDYLTEPEFLAGVFERHRGRSYERELRFSSFVYLISDALLEHRGSAHQALRRADEQGELEVSLEAMYAKLRRIPISLSNGLLAEGSQRLLELLPAPRNEVPASLREFTLLPIDGKKIKDAAKRLKPLRKVKGSVLGGKVLVALNLQTGLAMGMNACQDGEANDAPLVPDLLEQLRELVPGPRLYIFDRQFCDLTQPALLGPDEHFLIRYHSKVSFQRDKSRKIRRGVDAQGRSWREEWGWIGRAKDRRRRYVRRITLQREGGENVVLITDLLDGDAYPAADLLTAYLLRWSIERVFQKVTEVFHLESLIASTPEGTIFQCAFCLLLYNMLEVIRSYLAVTQQREPETISMENVFYDTHRHLVAWNELLGPTLTLEHFAPLHDARKLRKYLTALLKPTWTDRWIKAPPKKNTKPPKQTPTPGGHTSIYRVLQKARVQRKPKARDHPK